MHPDTAAASRGTLDAGGHRLAWSATGSGDPFLLVHGFAADRTLWAMVQPALAASGRAVAIDLPGHGASAPTLSGFADLVDAVVAAVDGLCGGTAHLVGHSAGAAAVLAAATRRPAIARALTLVSPAGLGGGLDVRLLAGIAGAADADILHGLLSRLVARPELVPRQMAVRMLAGLEVTGLSAALARLAEDLADLAGNAAAQRRDLAGLRCPRRILIGTADDVIEPAGLDGLDPAVDVRRLPGVGHMPPLEAARAVLSAILDPAVTGLTPP